MSDYDFKTLNDKEFEVLCTDLLSDYENKRFERFKAGRDAGVDGRYFKAIGEEVVLQCKHWANSPIELLISRLKTDERPKIAKLKPTRYLLAVSNPLSRNDKSVIFEALSPYIKNESDIFGREDLNDLIKSRPAIERRHYKLWLYSSGVIEHILHKPIFDRSQFSLEEILDSARKYFPTSNHNKALDKLEKLGVIIIIGEPGIGKTTLAEHLCLHYVAKGYELIKISHEIEEAEAVFHPDEKKIFYFDDFLGRNYLEALNGHEGSQIVQFIKRVTRSKNKRFILTSRSTILNQGKILIDLFKQQNLERNEYELTIESLTEIDKANILYNHIWHTDLPAEYLEEIYKDKRYKIIIKHKNFNPRLISFLTDSKRLENCQPSDYWTFVEEMLKNPTEVWENPFEAQQDDFGRAIVLLVTLNERSIEQGILAEAYSRYVSSPESSGLRGRKDFLLNLRHLTGSLLSRKVADVNEAYLNLFNPSIGDYVLRRYVNDIPTLKVAFSSLRSISSLSTLKNIWNNKLITFNAYIEIIKIILRSMAQNDLVGYSPTYAADAAMMLLNNVNDVKEDATLVSKIISLLTKQDVPASYASIANLYLWALKRGDISQQTAAEFIIRASEKGARKTYELECLNELADELDSDSDYYEDVVSELHTATINYLTDNISEEVDDSDLFGDVEYGDHKGARHRVRSFVINWLDDRDIKYDLSDVSAVVDAYDVEKGLSDYFEGLREDYVASSEGHVAVYSDEIDDLFERDMPKREV
jgi:adenylate kinase family enzyme